MLCPTCIYGPSKGSGASVREFLFYCCECGFGPQVAAVNPACCNCGHYYQRAFSLPLDTLGADTPVISLPENEGSLVSTFNQLLFQRAADPAQRWTPHSPNKETSSISDLSSTRTLLAPPPTAFLALPALEHPHDTLDYILGLSPSDPEVPGKADGAIPGHHLMQLSHDWPNSRKSFSKDMNGTDWPVPMFALDKEVPEEKMDYHNLWSNLPMARLATLLDNNDNASLSPVPIPLGSTNLDCQSPTSTAASETNDLGTTSESTGSTTAYTDSCGSVCDGSIGERETPDSTDLDPFDTTRTISRLTQKLVDRFMNSVHFFFDLHSGIIHYTGGPSNEQLCSLNYGNGSVSSPSRQLCRSSKRRKVAGSDKDPPNSDDDDNSDGNDDDKRRRLNNGKRAQLPKKRFACPYFKRNPEKHRMRRSCAGPGWFAIHQVKEHLYLYHQVRPCPRCYSDLRTDKALKAHLQATRICEKAAPRTYDGIDQAKEKQLKSRKGWSKRPDAEKWQAMYRILFPDDVTIDMPAPFYDDGPVTPALQNSEYRFERYCRHELPRRVRSKLETVVEKCLQQHGEDISNQIETIVRECYDGVVATYQEGNVGTSTPTMSHQSAAGKASFSATSPATFGDAISHDVGEDPIISPFTAPELSFGNFDTSGLEMPESSQFDPQVNPALSDLLGYSADPVCDTDDSFRDLDFSSDNFYGSLFPLADAMENDYASTSMLVSSMHFESNAESINDTDEGAVVNAIPEIRPPKQPENRHFHADITDLLQQEPEVW